MTRLLLSHMLLLLVSFLLLALAPSPITCQELVTGTDEDGPLGVAVVGGTLALGAGAIAAAKLAPLIAPKLVPLLAPKLSPLLAPKLGLLLAPKLGDLLATKLGEKLATKLGDKLAPKLGDLLAPKFGDKLAPKLGDKLASKLGEKLATKLGDLFAPKLGDKLASKLSDLLAPKFGDKLASKLGDKLASKLGLDKGSKFLKALEKGSKFLTSIKDKKEKFVTKIKDKKEKFVTKIKDTKSKILTSIKDKKKKFLKGGAIALAILKGLIVAKHLPLFLALHIGKKLITKKGKRDMRAQEQLQLVDDALELANQADSGDCIPKLLCYLESQPDTSLSHEAVTLRKSLGNLNKSDYLNTKTSLGVYGLATAIGATLGKRNLRTCDLVFKSCPLEYNVLLDVLNSTFKC